MKMYLQNFSSYHCISVDWRTLASTSGVKKLLKNTFNSLSVMADRISSKSDIRKATVTWRTATNSSQNIKSHPLRNLWIRPNKRCAHFHHNACAGDTDALYYRHVATAMRWCTRRESWYDSHL